MLEVWCTHWAQVSALNYIAWVGAALCHTDQRAWSSSLSAISYLSPLLCNIRIITMFTSKGWDNAVNELIPMNTAWKNSGYHMCPETVNCCNCCLDPLHDNTKGKLAYLPSKLESTGRRDRDNEPSWSCPTMSAWWFQALSRPIALKSCWFGWVRRASFCFAKGLNRARFLQTSTL